MPEARGKEGAADGSDDVPQVEQPSYPGHIHQSVQQIQSLFTNLSIQTEIHPEISSKHLCLYDEHKEDGSF